MLYALLLLPAAGCGFHAVYATDDGSQTPAKLGSVRVEKIETHDGQMLQNKLEDLLQPQGISAPAEYTVKIVLGTQKRELGIQTDSKITRYDLILSANYSLIRMVDNKTVDAGTVTVKSSYNRTSSEFATFVAGEDSGEKAAQELAQEIRSRLVYYFTK